MLRLKICRTKAELRELIGGGGGRYFTHINGDSVVLMYPQTFWRYFKHQDVLQQFTETLYDLVKAGDGMNDFEFEANKRETAEIRAHLEEVLRRRRKALHLLSTEFCPEALGWDR